MPSSIVGALRVVLGMNAGEFTQGASDAEKRLNKLSRNMEKFGQKTAKLGGVMSAGLTAPLGLFGKAAIDAAKNFEASMSNVSTLIDTNTESMQQMRAEVLRIGKETPVAISDLTGALYDIRSAGVDAKDAMGVLEGSARLAVAGLGTTKEATDLVTSSINAFGLQGEKAAKVYDVIFKTVKSGKTTISQLAQGFGAVAGTVSGAGVELDEYLASVAALTTTGLPAAQAHTQIRAAIAGLTRETELGRQVFQQLGAKDFKDLIEKSGGLVGAFKGIHGALGGNDAQLIKLLGSVEAYNALIGLTGKQNATYQSTLESMRTGTNAVDEAFAKQNSTVASMQQRMSNAMESMSISIGTILTPVVEKIAGAVSWVAEAFNSLSPEMKEIIVTIGTLVAGVGPLIAIFGGLVSGIGALIPVLATVGTAIAGLVVASGPIGLFIAAATTATAAWTLWGDNIKGLFETVVSFVTEKLNFLKDTVSGITDFFVGAWQAASDTLVGHSIIPDMVDMIGAEFERLDGWVTTVISRTAGMVGKNFDRMGKLGSNSMQRMGSDINRVLGALFQDSKAASIAQAIISTLTGMNRALELPFPANLAAAASVAAEGFANVAAIKSTNVGGGGGGSSGGSSAGASAGAGAAGAQPVQQQSFSINLEGESFGREQVRGLIESINDAISDGAVLRVA